MSNKIAAVLLNWNNYFDFKNCLDSLIRSNLNVDIIIVDNGSGDNSTKKIELEYPDFTYIYNGFNYGFSKGVNIGIRLALKEDYNYIFLLNNDAFIKSDTLEKLVQSLNSNQSFFISGPRIFYADNKEKIWFSYGLFRKLKMGIYSPEKNKLNKHIPIIGNVEVDFISGCAMLIKREVLEKIGLFDEDFFFYAEDLDFCLRAKKAGLKIRFVPESIVYHNIKEIKSSRTSKFVLYNLSKSFFLIIRKHFSVLWLIYGLLLFFVFYTPFRLYQIISGKSKFSNILFWLKGGVEGLFMRKNL